MSKKIVYAEKKRCEICVFFKWSNENMLPAIRPNFLKVNTGICKNTHSDCFNQKKYIYEICEQVTTIEYF